MLPFFCHLALFCFHADAGRRGDEDGGEGG